jgi:hypothetical protein
MAGTEAAPPGLEVIWSKLTPTESELVVRMWGNRHPDGLAVKDLYPLMGWETSLDPNKCFRTHHSHIITKFREAKVPVPWECAKGYIHWPRRKR